MTYFINFDLGDSNIKLRILNSKKIDLALSQSFFLPNHFLYTIVVGT